MKNFCDGNRRPNRCAVGTMKAHQSKKIAMAVLMIAIALGGTGCPGKQEEISMLDYMLSLALSCSKGESPPYVWLAYWTTSAGHVGVKAPITTFGTVPVCCEGSDPGKFGYISAAGTTEAFVASVTGCIYAIADQEKGYPFPKLKLHKCADLPQLNS